MLALARRSPFELLERIENRMEHLFGDLIGTSGNAGAPSWIPRAEAYLRDGRLVVRCDMPGVDPGNLHVTVTGRKLTISGERKAEEQVPEEDYLLRGIGYGSFERTFVVPEGIDPQAVTATYRHGVVHVEMPLPKELAGATVPISVEKTLTA